MIKEISLRLLHNKNTVNFEDELDKVFVNEKAIILADWEKLIWDMELRGVFLHRKLNSLNNGFECIFVTDKSDNFLSYFNNSLFQKLFTILKNNNWTIEHRVEDWSI